MGIPNKDELKGKVEKVVGRGKAAVGAATNDPELEAEGRADEAKGNVREGVGRVRRKVGEAVEDIGDRIKR